MIAVSNAWKEAHQQTLLPETFVEITMDIVDSTENVSVSGTNEAPYSFSSTVTNNTDFENYSKYAFLEHNVWSLDGSRIILQDTEGYLPPAYVSNDDTSGGLTIQLTPTSTDPIPGFTITWSSEFDSYASKFTVEVRNGEAVVATAVVTDNTSNISVVNMPITEYDSVSVTVQEWSHPDQRIRIDSVMLGLHLVFELSKNSIEFEVDNADGRWNILNPEGLTKYLYERQKLIVRYGIETKNGVEWVQAGVFYLTEWKAPSNGITATFVARDALEFMMNTTYRRDYLEGVTTAEVKVYSTMEGVVTTEGEVETGILVATLAAGTNVKVYEKAIQPHMTYGDDPDAAGWMLYRIDEGWARVDNINITSDTSLYADMQAAMSSCLPSDIPVYGGNSATTTSGPIAVEETNVAEFLQKCAASCGLPIYQLSDGAIRMYEPAIPLPVSVVISSDVAYSHPEIELSKPLKQVIMVHHYQHHSATKSTAFDVGSEGDIITVDCPYLWKSDSRIKNVADKYIAWWKQREVVSGEFRADPRLELFDCVQVETKYGVISPVMLTRIKYTYSGSFRGEYEGKVITEQEV